MKQLRKRRILAFILSMAMMLSSVNVGFAEEADSLQADYISESVETGESVSIDEDEEIETLYSTTDIAYAVEGGDIYFDAETGTITDADETITSAVIPSEINGVAVTSIGGFAFCNCSSSLESITIPDSVTSIDWGAFEGCSSLTSVTIGNGVTSIVGYAFCNCSSLTSIAIPDSVTSIGNFAFSGCSSLTSVTIPNSVTSIDDCAFYKCSSLADINVDENNNTYASVDGILYDKSITTLVACGGARTSVTIPDGITSIGRGAFCTCYSLINVIIPESVTSIANSAFEDCSSLTSIEIPESVTSIANSAFEDCSSLTDVYYTGSEDDWNEISIDNSYNSNDYLLNATIHYNSSMPATESTTTTETTTESTTESTTGNTTESATETTTESITESTTESITESTTESTTENTTMVKVEVNTNGEVVGVDSGVTDFYIPDVVDGVEIKSIDESIFENCSSLKTISIPKTVEKFDTTKIPETVKIYIVKDSAIESYFIENNVSYAYESTIMGDVDGNNSINATDALQVLQYALNPDSLSTSPHSVENMKVNGNELITATDALSIIQKSLNSDYVFDVEK